MWFYQCLMIFEPQTLVNLIKYLLSSKKEKAFNTGECMQLFVGKVSAERLLYSMPELKSFSIL